VTRIDPPARTPSTTAGHLTAPPAALSSDATRASSPPRRGAPARLLALTALTLSDLTLAAAPPALAAPPETPLTEPPTAITAESAVFHGQPNPLTEATVGYEFHFNTTGVCEGNTVGGVAPALLPAATKVKTEPPVTGLEPNKAYKVCMVASNELAEVTPGNEVPFKTLPAKPAITAESASAVKSTTATLEAQVNPNNQPTTFTIEYSTKGKTGPGEKLQAPITKTAGAPPALEGFGPQTATIPSLSGLAPGKPIFFRVVAKNATGTTTGTVSTFTTVPTPTTLAASAETTESATLNGEVNPLVAGTMFSFSYALGAECTGEGTLATPAAEATGTAVTTDVSALQPNATYSACLIASNTFGSEQAASLPFKTLPAPPVIEAASESATELSDTAATLHAKVNPNNQATTVFFEFATTKALIEEGKGLRSSGPALSAAFGFQPVSATAGEGTALLPRTTYFYRAVAENEQSTTEVKPVTGEILEFRTLAKPLVATEPAEAITRTTASLSGTVNPGGLESTYHFAYVPQSEYEPGAPNPYARGATTPESLGVGSDYAEHAAGPTVISELAAGETYDFTLVASNSAGTQYAPDRTFTTAAKLLPIAATGPATGIGMQSATLTGTVDTRGLATVVQFEVGPQGAGTLEAASPVPGSETGTTLGVSYTFAGSLAPGTTYSYRLIARSSDGAQAGAEQSFTTAGLPATVALPAGFPFIPYTSITELNAREAQENKPSPPKPLTSKQKLTKALAACHRTRNRHRRTACERQAHRRYGPKSRK
jgi:hypothetical protein